MDCGLLKKIATPEEYILIIQKYDEKYGATIEEISREYMLSKQLEPLVPYINAKERTTAHNRAKAYIKRLNDISEDEETRLMLNYLFWLHCVPYAKETYSLLGIDTEIFYDSMSDIACKAKECEDVYGCVGVFADWFFLFFDMKLFGLGRLQYEIERFAGDDYCVNGYELKRGSVVYSTHIPAVGPLTRELCLDSFQRAYEFFKKDLDDVVIPIVTDSWLLYPPYLGTIFSKGSNTYNFARMFDVIEVDESPDFEDCWRVFGKNYEGTTTGLPTDTGMRKRFVDYIDAGGTFGCGYGVLLYNGEKREIINIKG